MRGVVQNKAVVVANVCKHTPRQPPIYGSSKEKRVHHQNDGGDLGFCPRPRTKYVDFESPPSY